VGDFFSSLGAILLCTLCTGGFVFLAIWAFVQNNGGGGTWRTRREPEYTASLSLRYNDVPWLQRELEQRGFTSNSDGGLPVFYFNGVPVVVVEPHGDDCMAHIKSTASTMAQDAAEQVFRTIAED
jgi:hypothetical protein